MEQKHECNKAIYWVYYYCILIEISSFGGSQLSWRKNMGVRKRNGVDELVWGGKYN